METTVKLYSLTCKETRTYLFVTLFVAGNILLPQLCHLLPGGGLVFLPIYFFTLIAAYKYGIQVGLLTALLSPLLNNLLFGMPPAAVLPVILIKSGLLTIAASYVARAFGKVSLVALGLAILAYQLVGTLAEWAIAGDIRVAIQDFRIGIPGMLVQLFGGYGILKAIHKIEHDGGKNV